MYVVAGHRTKGVASRLVDTISTIAKDFGDRYVMVSVDPRTNGATTSTKAILGYGFNLNSIQGNLIWFEKEI